tara:strand:+ start:48 stop:356 length:309 start_codon:yes stop_codon:yes gene_type:complete
MIDVDKLSEGIDYKLIPAPDNEQAWNIRVLTGPYIETVVQFGAISINGPEEAINFNFTIIESPDDSLTVEDKHFQEFCGLVLHDVIEMAISKDELIMKDKNE